MQHKKEYDAVECFNSLYYKKYYIIPSNESIPGFECLGNTIISYEELCLLLKKHPLLNDLYISHTNFKWMFVITHENDFGPYF